MAKEQAENLEHLHVQLQNLTKYDEVMKIAQVNSQ